MAPTTNPPPQRFVEFVLDTVHFAFALEDVQRVIRAVAVTPVPGAGRCVMGAIDLHGTIVPVFDTRALLGLESRTLQPSDHFMIAHGSRTRAFAVDRVVGSFECSLLERPASYLMGVARLQGVARRGDGMILVHDLKRFMALDHAMPLEPVRD